MANLENEQAISLLILSVLDECLQEKGYPKEYLSKTKVHKILYDVVEELDVDVTRSWYLRGKYVWGAQEAIEMYVYPSFNLQYSKENFQRFNLDKSRVREAVEAAIKRFEVLFTELMTYLSILYRHDAPEKFRDLYISNLLLKEKFEEFMDELMACVDKSSLLQYLTPQISVDYLSSSITKLHLALSKLGDLADPVLEYTTLIDELIIGAEEKANNGEIKEEHIDFLKRVYSFYDNTVWKLPSTHIAEKTLKGPGKQQLEEWLRNQQHRLIEAVEGQIPKVEEQASKIGLFPSESYLANRMEWDEASRDYHTLMTEYIR